jgi:curved DNA-binding protein CbpA
LKTYYELLGIAPNAPTDEIKRAFRKEIARYHPDKVQHLGDEFQEIAAVRAAELTEAYRVLMDEVARRKYDDGLAEGTPAPRTQPSGERSTSAPSTPAASAQPWTEPEDRPDSRVTHARATTSDFVRKAALGRLREAVAAVAGSAEASPSRGLDAVFALKPKAGLFRKAEPAVRLLVKFVATVDAPAIEAAWPLALQAGDQGETVCLMMLGEGQLAPARELSVAVAEQRRRARKTGPVLIPVDIRVWEALFPPEVPASVRAIVQRLKEGKL